MKHCPREYYDNCRNAVYKCNKCKAGYGSSKDKLYYNPLSQLYPVHPVENILPTKNDAIRRGLKEETKTVQQWITKTIKSGSVLGDGDVKVGDLKLDVKTRTNTKSFTLKAQEYDTGIRKDYDGWIIVNKDGKRIVCLTEDSFLKLSGQLLEEISNL